MSNNAIKFAEFTRQEHATGMAIIARAAALYEEKFPGEQLDRLSLYMDLEATHAQCPLNLEKLAKADDFNFVHDVFGIIRHMDRSTGKLGGCFLPRCAA